jgi:hypothetical protein
MLRFASITVNPRDLSVANSLNGVRQNQLAPRTPTVDVLTHHRFRHAAPDIRFTAPWKRLQQRLSRALQFDSEMGAA